jgi:hypothetical protein
MGIKKATESRFMRAVITFAKLHRWESYHTHDSRRSDPGFPDLVLVRGGRIVFAELKLTGKKPTPEQYRWLDLLRAVALAAPHAVEVYLWTPADWNQIEQKLGQDRP